ncbi:MAG: exo-alpha-sialidase [Cyclobacteriaceae bacterium]|nr:exo-alpha-sialidase [Cyclobacteriaceae bacterium]
MNRLLNFVLYIIVLVQLSCSNTEKTNDKVLTTHIKSPAGDNTEEPHLTEGADGNLYMSWIEKKKDTASLFYAKWKDTTWSVPEKIAEGNNWFVNWADYPAISINKSGDIIAHYLEKSASGTYTYDVKVVAKKATEKIWSNPIKLHSDTVNAEHGFVSMQPYEDGRFFLTWLDGRNTASNNEHSGHGNSNGAMTIRGAIVDTNLNIVDTWELDARTCDCCQTGATIVDNNPIAVYRDRSEDEIRDISIVKYTNENWSEPKPIYPDNWKIAGCPVNGPRIATNNGSIAIAWFSASNNSPQVKLIFSDDIGETFSSPVIVDDSFPLGRVDVGMLDNSTAIVSWLDKGKTEAEIKVAKFNKEGIIGDIIVVAQSKESRSSGFPQMAIYNKKLFFAWTDANKPSHIKLTKLQL